MPELPEVETVRRDLESEVVGRTIVRVTVSRRWQELPHKQFQGMRSFRGQLLGGAILSVDRHGKYLLVKLDRGWLVLHLGMSGSLLLSPPHEMSPNMRNHLHAQFALSDGRSLLFQDPRMFGVFEAVGGLGESDRLSRLGPDALDPALRSSFNRLIADRRTPIKSALLNQSIIAGVGNIYADESLWRARIHPMTNCDRLRVEETRTLLTSIRAVLRTALRNRGTSFDAVYQRGNHAPRVYGREGQPCFRCGTPLVGGVISNRSFCACPKCQRKR